MFQDTDRLSSVSGFMAAFLRVMERLKLARGESNSYLIASKAIALPVMLLAVILSEIRRSRTFSGFAALELS